MLRNLSTRLGRACCVVCVLLLVNPVSAATLIWNGSNGNWDTDANWSTSNEPTAADVAVIDRGTVYVTLLGETAHDLYVSGGGGGTLNIRSGGLVTVGGSTSIGTGGSVNLNGGRFEFGETSLAEFTAVNKVSGSMAGDLPIGGFTALSGLPSSLQVTAVDLSDVRLVNEGVLYGDGWVESGLTNQAEGQVQTMAGERMLFGGGGTNAGTFSNFGGQVYLDGAFANEADGTIAGRGSFIANGGWTNTGEMIFSGGFTDIVGDVEVTATGYIITSGGAVTTFYDDLIHNGVEIRTAPGSQTVIFGNASGVGSFTETGLVSFEGGYAPGASPAEVFFGGDVTFGGSALLEIELGGLTPGSEHDVLNIAGTLTVGGTLDVLLIDAFAPGFGDSFDILNFGAVVGSFDTINLPTIHEDLVWNHRQLLVDGTLSVGLAGDLDGNGIVDLADLALILNNWNEQPPDVPEADPDGDGIVGLADLAYVLNNWDNSAPATPSNIPEPATLSLLGIGGLLLSGHMRQAQKLGS